MKERGIRGLFRGYIPGLLCVSTRNGASMMVMQKSHDMIAYFGLRGPKNKGK